MMWWIGGYLFLMVAYIGTGCSFLEEAKTNYNLREHKPFIARLTLLGPVWPVGLVWLACIGVDRLLEIAELKK